MKKRGALLPYDLPLNSGLPSRERIHVPPKPGNRLKSAGIRKGDFPIVPRRKYSMILYTLRILGPSNGGVNEPLFFAGVFLGPQNSHF